jgi:hypothetical protein
MRRLVLRTASLDALASLISTAALAHPGLPGHTHDGLAGGSDYLVAMITGVLAALLTVWALARRSARSN